LGGIAAMIRRAAGYLAQNGPISPQDRWEENPGSALSRSASKSPRSLPLPIT
jgi:hypothetical protein